MSSLEVFETLEDTIGMKHGEWVEEALKSDDNLVVIALRPENLVTGITFTRECLISINLLLERDST
ncbi:MAG: hypothetical protein JEY99_21295 [Spirochaetales bacterium]|nr:hypothetical protein [Spirochaetales bacterium]